MCVQLQFFLTKATFLWCVCLQQKIVLNIKDQQSLYVLHEKLIGQTYFMFYFKTWNEDYKIAFRICQIQQQLLKQDVSCNNGCELDLITMSFALTASSELHNSDVMTHGLCSVSNRQNLKHFICIFQYVCRKITLPRLSNTF